MMKMTWYPKDSDQQILRWETVDIACTTEWEAQVRALLETAYRDGEAAAPKEASRAGGYRCSACPRTRAVIRTAAR